MGPHDGSRRRCPECALACGCRRRRRWAGRSGGRLCWPDGPPKPSGMAPDRATRASRTTTLPTPPWAGQIPTGSATSNDAGRVSAGTDHDTAAFVLNTVATGWLRVGKPMHPSASRLLTGSHQRSWCAHCASRGRALVTSVCSRRFSVPIPRPWPWRADGQAHQHIAHRPEGFVRDVGRGARPTVRSAAWTSDAAGRWQAGAPTDIAGSALDSVHR